VRCRLRNTRHRAAGSAAEVGIIALWLQDPVTPSDVPKGYVQVFATALCHSAGAVYATLLAAFPPPVLHVDHDERPVVLVHGDNLLHVADLAAPAGDLNEVAQLMTADPMLDGPLNVDLHPLIWKNNY